MYYKSTGKAELSQEEMERIRKGFSGLLWKVGFGSEFIAKNCDELLSKAYLEYVRYTDKGVEIEDPVAWTIHVAWRRTQNFLTLSNSRPREVSSETLAELIDEATPTSAEIAEDTDRVRKLHDAVGKLEEDQRQLLALVYFEDKPLAEAARRLGWHESKARRCHKAALNRVHELLGVESSDELVEVGLAASLSFSGIGPLHLHAGFEAVVEKAGHEASGLWARAHDLARRFNLGGGGDAASAVATSGAGRTAGVCATVAVACIAGASGVVGPGVGGGIGLLDNHDRPQRTRPATETIATAGSLASAESEDSLSPSTEPEQSGYSAGDSSSGAASRHATGSRKPTPKTEREQVKAQTSGFARASGESGGGESIPSPSSPASASSTSSESASATSSPARPSGESSTETAQAKQQFGAFK